jgi:ribonuclease J
VHGEAAHLAAQGSLMAMTGIGQVAQVRDGDMLRLAPGPAAIIGKVPFGRIYKDGRLIGTEQAMGIKDRRKLSFAGHVVVNVVLDEKYELAGDPDLVAIGVAEVDRRGEALEDLMLDAAIGAVDSIPRQRRKDLDMIQEAVRRAVRSAANEAWGKKPVVTVFVTR